MGSSRLFAKKAIGFAKEMKDVRLRCMALYSGLGISAHDLGVTGKSRFFPSKITAFTARIHPLR